MSLIEQIQTCNSIYPKQILYWQKLYTYTLYIKSVFLAIILSYALNVHLYKHSHRRDDIFTSLILCIIGITYTISTLRMLKQNYTRNPDSNI